MESFQEYEELIRRMRKQFVLELLRFKTLYRNTTEEINDYYHLNYSENPMTVIAVKCYAKDGNYNDMASVMALVEQYMYDCLRPWFHELETAHDNMYVIGVYDITSPPESNETNRFKAAIAQFFNSINTDIAYERYDFVLGTGKVVFKISDLPKCLDSALYAVNSSIIYGVNQGYDSNLMETPEGDISLLLTPARKQHLIHSIETLNPEGLNSTIREIFITDRDYYSHHPNIAYRIANSILLVCVSVISDHIGSQYYTEKKLIQATTAFSRCSNVSVLSRTCREAAQDIYQTYRDHLERCNHLPIADAKRYILRNYQKRISLSDIAKSVGLSTPYLSSLFKKQTGTSIVHYITDIRIEAAKALLVKTTISVTRLAEHTGFDDPKYFSRVFRAKVGVSPREYRKMNAVALSPPSQ